MENGSHSGGPFDAKNLTSYFLIILLLYSLYLGYALMEPFLHTFIFTAVLAIMCYPVFTWILEKCDGRRTLASVLTVLLVVFAIVLPMVIVVLALIGQGVESLAAINNWAAQNDMKQLLATGNLDKYLDWLHQQMPFLNLEDMDFKQRLLDFSRSLAQTMVGLSTGVVKNAMQMVMNFLLMVFMLFYLLRDGREMIKYIKYLSPLRDSQEDYIIESLKRVSKGVLMGCLLVALLQGIVGGFGLAVCGIPGVFWGAMTAFCSLIPVVGTGIIWVPAVGYLLIIGEWKMALFLGLWFGLVVVSIDTFLRPMFMREAAQVSTFYIFLAILGGVYSFGMLGIFYGPLILSFLMVMLNIYGEEYAELLGRRDEA